MHFISYLPHQQRNLTYQTHKANWTLPWLTLSKDKNIALHWMWVSKMVHFVGKTCTEKRNLCKLLFWFQGTTLRHLIFKSCSLLKCQHQIPSNGTLKAHSAEQTHSGMTSLLPSLCLGFYTTFNSWEHNNSGKLLSMVSDSVRLCGTDEHL